MGKIALGFLPLLIVQAGCLSNESVRVNSYWGTTIDRPPPGSVYDWSAESAHLEPGQDPHVARAIQENVERELSAIGYVKSTGTQAPDLLIYVHIGRGLQPSPSGPEQRAALGIRVISAADGRVIYCASADALIEGTLCPEDRRSRLDYAVHEIIRPLGHCPKGRHSHHSACSRGSNCGR